MRMVLAGTGASAELGVPAIRAIAESYLARLRDAGYSTPHRCLKSWSAFSPLRTSTWRTSSTISTAPVQVQVLVSAGE